MLIKHAKQMKGKKKKKCNQLTLIEGVKNIFKPRKKNDFFLKGFCIIDFIELRSRNRNFIAEIHFYDKQKMSSLR